MTATLFVNGHQETLDMVSTDLELLYHEVVPTLAKRIEGDFADIAEVNLWQECLHLSSLNKDDFNIAYQLSMQACDKHKSLEKYKKRLDNLFKSDPRFNP